MPCSVQSKTCDNLLKADQDLEKAILASLEEAERAYCRHRKAQRELLMKDKSNGVYFKSEAGCADGSTDVVILE